MSKIASAAIVSILLLVACGSRPETSEQNGSVGYGAEANALENAGSSNPAEAVAPADGAVEPVPPDAVSHPNGYLPLGPGEPVPANENSSVSKESPPATEDEYLRNRQAGR